MPLANIFHSCIDKARQIFSAGRCQRRWDNSRIPRIYSQTCSRQFEAPLWIQYILYSKFHSLLREFGLLCSGKREDNRKAIHFQFRKHHGAQEERCNGPCPSLFPLSQK